MEVNIEKKEGRIFGLDVIRATAILLVLGSHLYYVLGSSNPALISLSGLAGYAGVELFFVLSGFLIGGILLKQFLAEEFTMSKLLVFLKRRWFRTLPNYYLVLLINFALAWYFGYFSEKWYVYLLFFQNFKTYWITFFSESWSLSVEEWTYVLIPISLLLASKMNLLKARKWKFFGMVLLLILVAHFFRYLAFLNGKWSTLEEWNTQLKSIVIYRFDTILFGVLLAWIYQFYTDFLREKSVYMLILGAHLFVFQFFILNVLQVDIISCPLYFHVFYFSLSSLVFFLCLPYFIFWKKSENRVSKTIVWISKTSYSAYLLHYSIVSVLLKYVLEYYALALPSAVIAILFLGITFGLSYLLYRFYELPMMNLRDRR